jgi:hypothetical protein
VTPEQEEQVRRVLGAVAHGDRDPVMPADVASRLDDVLADLTAPRVAPAAPDPREASASRVDELAARRRRHHRHQLLVAAAVGVIAVAGGAVATDGYGRGGGSGGASRAGSAPATAPTAPGTAPDSTSGLDPDAVPRLRTATLAHDVQLVVGRRTTGLSPGTPASPSAPRSQARLVPEGSPTSERSCAVPTGRPGGRPVDVLLDGRPATLLVTAPRDGLATARVFSCTTGALLATTTVRDR